MLLDDLLVAENSLFQSDSDSPMLTSERGSPIGSPKLNVSGVAPATSPTSDSALDISSGGYYTAFPVSADLLFLKYSPEFVMPAVQLFLFSPNLVSPLCFPLFPATRLCAYGHSL